LVIVDETVVTQHLWLLPSPARAALALSLDRQGEGSEMEAREGSKKFTNSENDSLEDLSAH